MRKKKILSIVAALVIAICVLAGCGGNVLPYTTDFTGKLPDNYIAANAGKNFGTPFAGYTKAVKLPENFTYVDTNINYGYIIVGREVGDETKFGVYSLTDDLLILSCVYENIELSRLYYTVTPSANVPSRTHVIAKVENSVEQTGIYNLTDKNFMINMGEYSSVSVEVIGSYEYRKTQLVGINKEEIDTYKAVVNDDWTIKRIKQERQGEVGTVLSPNLNLVTYPFVPELDGYSYLITDSKIVGYKNGEQIFEVFLNSGSADITDSIDIADLVDINVASFTIGKYRYYQYHAMLPIDAKDYDYSYSVIKFKLTTCRLDLTNGKIKEYSNFKYFIESSDNVTIKSDKDGNYAYALAYCRKINGDKLLDAYENILFNDNLEEEVNLSRLSIGSTVKKMSSDRFLSEDYIIDADGKVIADLSGYYNVKYCPEENVISLSKNNYNNYGLIDINGKVLIPFEYQSAFTFYNGFARNYNNVDREYYLLSKNGTKGGDFEDVTFYTGGLVYSSEENVYTFKNYAGTEILKIEDCSSLVSVTAFYGDGSSYLTGTLIKAKVSGSDVYYILK